ncbi:MAG: DUF5615 family PIN-like protein [Pyrinomonadaceae bacterium]
MIWIDAQLSPSIAAWITADLGIDAKALRDLGLRDSEDEDIYLAARNANAIVMTKDSDFVLLLERFGPPPKVILLTCGNTSNDSLKKILTATLSEALQLLDRGDSLVEIG